MKLLGCTVGRGRVSDTFEDYRLSTCLFYGGPALGIIARSSVVIGGNIFVSFKSEKESWITP